MREWSTPACQRVSGAELEIAVVECMGGFLGGRGVEMGMAMNEASGKRGGYFSGAEFPGDYFSGVMAVPIRGKVRSAAILVEPSLAE